MMRNTKPYMFLIATLVWGIPGVIITTKGIMAYTQLPTIKWWLFVITLSVIAAFYLIFKKVVTRYSAHIENLPTKCPLWRTFSLRGWALILFMIALGISLRLIKGIPIGFFSSFYTGLGPMLIWSSRLFLKKVKFNDN